MTFSVNSVRSLFEGLSHAFPHSQRFLSVFRILSAFSVFAVLNPYLAAFKPDLAVLRMNVFSRLTFLADPAVHPLRVHPPYTPVYTTLARHAV